jgi:c-di-GMP-binding flagellar brake protein YcgR
MLSRPGSGMFDAQQTEKTSRNQMADMSEGDLANMAATNRVEALDGYPTMEDFSAHMPAETAATLWENVRMHFNTCELNSSSYLKKSLEIKAHRRIYQYWKLSKVGI